MCGIAASKINRPIVEGDASFAVIPVKDRESVEKALKDFDSVVLMKVSRNYDYVVKTLKENDFHGTLVTRCGQEGEKVEFDFDKYVGKQIDYLSLIIGRRNNQ